MAPDAFERPPRRPLFVVQAAGLRITFKPAGLLDFDDRFDVDAAVRVVLRLERADVVTMSISPEGAELTAFARFERLRIRRATPSGKDDDGDRFTSFRRAGGSERDPARVEQNVAKLYLRASSHHLRHVGFRRFFPGLEKRVVRSSSRVVRGRLCHSGRRTSRRKRR